MKINQVIAHRVLARDKVYYRIDKDTWLHKVYTGVVVRILGVELLQLEREYSAQLKEDFNDDVYA